MKGIEIMITLKSKLIAVGVVLGALTAPLAASAHPYYYHHSVNGRWNHQEYRIERGIRTGQLTPWETARIERREAELRRQEAIDRARHHGHLTYAEQRRLEREENRLSHEIYHEKHDHDRY